MAILNESDWSTLNDPTQVILSDLQVTTIELSSPESLPQLIMSLKHLHSHTVQFKVLVREDHRNESLMWTRTMTIELLKDGVGRKKSG